MLVAFTITSINYLVVSTFCDVVLPLSYLYWPAIYIYFNICDIRFFWLRYLPCFPHRDKSSYSFPVIILVGAHQAELFSNKCSL